MDIANREEVIGLFGEWPSFHDAEVISIELKRDELPGQHADLYASVQVRKYLPVDVGTAKYDMAVTHDGVISFKFSGIDGLDLNRFNQQNVIDDMSLAQEGAQINVNFVSIFGVECSFKCAGVAVISVENRLQSKA